MTCLSEGIDVPWIHLLTLVYRHSSRQMLNPIMGPPAPTNIQWFCGNKMPTRCNRGFYCRSYCLLNMFRASLCPSSGAQEYYTVVVACGILCCGFSSSWSGVELRVMRPVCRMLVNQTHNPQLHIRPATWKTTAQNTTRSNHCIILLSFWWWA